MSAAGGDLISVWVLVGIGMAAWVVVGLVLAVLIGRIIAARDRQVPRDVIDPFGPGVEDVPVKRVKFRQRLRP